MRLRSAALLTWPALALCALVVLPTLLLIRISLAPPDPDGLWRSGVVFEAYRDLAEPAWLATLAYSLCMAFLVAAIGLGLGFPLTLMITRMRRSHQVTWLVLLLATLTLSDVLIAFSWQVMLSKRIGLSRMLVWLGLMPQVDSLTPGAGAVIVSMVYLVLPFTMLTLYPSLSAMPTEQLEAARLLGASPRIVLRTVIIPLNRAAALTAFAVSALLALGTYVCPLVLGRPQNWTMAVMIGNAALAGHNVPRAAAMSIALVAATLGVCGAVFVGARRRWH
jgi:putative spermidine/putrescine transport system permease protein